MNLLEDARALLAEFTHDDPGQLALAQEYIDFVDRHDDAVWRSCRVGHVTASAIVIDESEGQVLLTLHPKVGRWLQLGGHLESGDTSIVQGALREVREESGISHGRISALPIRLDRHDVPCGRDEQGQPLASVHWDVQFLVLAPDAVDLVMSDESDDLAWFSADLQPDVDASVRALVADAQGWRDSDERRSWLIFG
jgi:8-oxo-dGTP pyrophosphatase MutT (NUDIX family)